MAMTTSEAREQAMETYLKSSEGKPRRDAIQEQIEIFEKALETAIANAKPIHDRPEEELVFYFIVRTEVRWYPEVIKEIKVNRGFNIKELVSTIDRNNRKRTVLERDTLFAHMAGYEGLIGYRIYF